MLIPGDIDPQPFFLTVHRDTGEIFCAHQEYLAVNADGQGRLLMRPADDETVLDIAVKANPAAEAAREHLRVVRVVCEPTVNFSRYVVDLRTSQLAPREWAEPGDTDVRRDLDGGEQATPS
jgi:hypothetical protein